MKNKRRILSILLSLLLLAGLLPAAAAGARGADAAGLRIFSEADALRLEQDVFAKIDAVLDGAAKRLGGRQAMRAADYCALLPAVRAAVEGSETYAPGSLRQNGSFLCWRTLEGFACFFDPRTEALLQGCRRSSAAGTPQPAVIPPQGGEEIEGGNPTAFRIGIIQPFWEHDDVYLQSIFTEAGPKYMAAVEKLSACTGGAVLRYNAESSTIDNVAAVMERCGVAIFESHGVTDYYDPQNDDETSQANCSYLMLLNPVGLSREDMEWATGPFGEYAYAMVGHGCAAVSGTCISRHMEQDAPHSLLYTGICSGMATDGLFAPLRERGVETVWGYSQPVFAVGDTMYMEEILDGVSEGRSFSEAVGRAKAKYGSWDPVFSAYSEEQCVAERIAFPIVVSSEDPWPGREQVNAVQNVNSAWRLLGTEYSVQAVPDDPAHGSVSVMRTRVTATPAAGWQVAGARVIRGQAEFRQEGGVFAVLPASNCVLEVCFTQKQPVTLRCFAGGSELCALEGLQGDPIPLPDSAPEVPGWSLAGWSEDCPGLTDDCPALLAPGGTVVTAEDLCLHAVYRKEIENGAEVFRLVDGEREDWTGDYVISSAHEGPGVRLMCGIEAGRFYEDYSSGGLIFLAETDVIREETLLRNVADCYVFRFEQVLPEVYTIQSKFFGSYLGNNLEQLYANNSAALDWCRWEISFRQTPQLHSRLNNRYTMLACFSDYGFTLYSNSYNSIWLWHREPGPLRLYHGDPGAAHEHLAGEPREESRTEPGCTEAGSRELVTRCVICDTVLARSTESLPAPGHDWQSPVYTWAEDNGSVSACRVCARDAGHTEQETAQTESEIVREPSETEEGELRYTARFGNPAFTVQTKTVVLPRLEPAEPFDDVRAGEYWYEAVRWAWAHSPRIANGVADRLFKPQNACTRAQIVSFLWRAAGEPEPETAADPFTDLQSDRYYYKAVLWAAERGIAFGFGDGSFRPGTGCSRAEALSFLWRYAGSPEPQTASCPFADVPEGAYYRSAVLWAAERGITVGVGSGAFRPGARCTRGQIVCFLYRLSEEPIG